MSREKSTSILPGSRFLICGKYAHRKEFDRATRSYWYILFYPEPSVLQATTGLTLLVCAAVGVLIVFTRAAERSKCEVARQYADG